MNTFGSHIHAALDAIKALPISMLDKRQPLLIDLLVDIVNHETNDGEELVHHAGVMSQPFWNTLKMYAQDVGFTFLGAGHFSAAFEHELLPERVIKVGFKKEDSGAAYAAWCRMNQGRIGVPTIHAIARHAGCYTVVLDKLTRLEPHGEHEGRTATCQFELAIATLYGRDEDIWDEFSMDLKQTVHDIRVFFKDIASFDLHSDNAMVDKHGNIVITDPVSWTQEGKLSRDKFQIDPDELIEEIKAAADREEDDRKANEKAMAEARLAQRQDIRDENNARQIMGRTHWRDVWLAHDVRPLREIEQAKARQFHNDMQWRVAAGLPLRCDLELANLLQG